MKDPATALYYSGARWYNAGIGRFITEDSYSGQINAPLSENRYIYAADNPESKVDPTGHDANGGSGGSGTSASGLEWLEQYVLSNLLSIGAQLAAVILAFLGPTAAILNINVYAIAASEVGLALGPDLESLAMDIAGHNIPGFTASLLNSAWDIFDTIMHGLSWEQLLALSLTESAWTAGTAGYGDLVDISSGLIALGIFIASFIWQEYWAYEDHLNDN
jgi:RHS repeat-associated protein